MRNARMPVISPGAPWLQSKASSAWVKFQVSITEASSTHSHLHRRSKTNPAGQFHSYHLILIFKAEFILFTSSHYIRWGDALFCPDLATLPSLVKSGSWSVRSQAVNLTEICFHLMLTLPVQILSSFRFKCWRGMPNANVYLCSHKAACLSGQWGLEKFGNCCLGPGKAKGRRVFF